MSSQAYNPAIASSMPHPAAYGAPVPVAGPVAPAGTFAPGTKIQVGSHKVVIQKYFSEGGFAHVYLVKMPKAIDGTDIAVLKRVAVPDKDALANMRTEVETMKKLKGHRPIVTYYDSHASQLKGGGYEVFLLMEFCNGGGLIDFMNTRLQNRLTEPEILKIFSDVTEGVACMHYLKPPLLHRDLKVENVLITSSGTSRRFKVCDFGSTAPPRPAATNVAECRLIEEDIQKHTTLQYRSPEMIDVYRKQPIDEKSDIWALGVLLYKLCYYTTPFEEQGQLAILNASYKFPAYPPFSDNLKKLIASMLREQPQARPNVYQVLREACMMQGIECPIKDIYAGRTQSESRRNQQLPPLPDAKSPPTVGAVYSPPQPTKQYIPEVVPMRRGRPTAAPATTAKPSPSPMRGTASDPFAALDVKSPPTLSPPALATDDISSRFPSLDQFSLLHEKGSKFEFDSSSPTSVTSPPVQKPISQRVTEKLADDAFAAAQAKPSAAPPTQPKPSQSVSRAQMIISSNPELQKVASAPNPTLRQTSPERPKMVSQGTMTTPDTTPIDRPANSYLPSNPTSDYKSPPIYRFPPADHHRSSSVPRNQTPVMPVSANLSVESQRPALMTRTASYQPRSVSHIRQASSSRPSLEGGRPSLEGIDPLSRTRSSTGNKPRPASVYLESDLDYLRERETSRKDGKISSSPAELAMSVGSDSGGDEPIKSNVEFLRSMEEADNVSKHRRNGSSSSAKASKRASMPSMSLSGTKTLLAGKFGDAFKRFENNTTSNDARPRTPSPLQELDRRELTPIAGSEATDGRSDDGNVDEPIMTAAQKRDLERLRLEQEEQRVAQAAAEYRRRIADREAGGLSNGSVSGGKAAAIQSKVRSLLDENSKPTAPKTAEGYGRFTDTNSSTHSQVRKFQSNAELRPAPNIGRKPDLRPSTPGTTTASSLDRNAPDLTYAKVRSAHTGLNTSPGRNRPFAPPKPVHLGATSTGSTASGLHDRVEMPRRDMTPSEKEDYIADFSKRFPSLSGIEMVEARMGGKEV